MNEHLTILSRKDGASPWTVAAHTKMRTQAFAAYWTARGVSGAGNVMMLRRQPKSRNDAVGLLRARNRGETTTPEPEAFDPAQFMAAPEPVQAPVVAEYVQPLAAPGTQLRMLQDRVAAMKAK